MVKIISVANQKGGVGKTTTSINLATSLSAINKKTLLIDADPQGNASTGIGISYENRSPNLYNLIVNENLDLNAIKKTIVPGLDIITANTNLAASEIELVEVKNREFVLSKLLSKIEGYDYILIDCPPSLSLLTINAFTAADSLLIPVQCEFFAMEGLAQLNKTIELIISRLNPSLEIEGLLLTMYDSRNNICKTVASEVKEFFKEKVLKTLIPKNVKLAESPSFGKCIFDYDSECLGAISYLNLSKEIISKNGGTFIEKIIR